MSFITCKLKSLSFITCKLNICHLLHVSSRVCHLLHVSSRVCHLLHVSLRVCHLLSSCLWVITSALKCMDVNLCHFKMFESPFIKHYLKNQWPLDTVFFFKLVLAENLISNCKHLCLISLHFKITMEQLWTPVTKLLLTHCNFHN